MSKKVRKISVSVMCSDLLNLERDIKELEFLGVDFLHIDIMDAHLVPNLTFGPDFAKAMRSAVKMPLDIHLMTDLPDLIIPKLEISEGEMFSLHVELNMDFSDLAKYVHSRGAKFGLVLNPETKVDSLLPHLKNIDLVTLMLVRPGFSGGTLIDGILDKVEETRKLLDSNGCEDVLLSVDGSVNLERANIMAKMGANVFVGGTAGIYRKGMKLEDTIPAFRKAIDV